MKIIKAKVYYTKDATGTHYGGGYPKTWEASKIPFIVYCDTGNDGKDFHNVLAIVPDDLYEVMKVDEQCEEISKVDAIALGSVYRPQVDKIVNSQKVLLILAKQASGQELTQQEKDALDANNEEMGINKGKSFEQICTDYGVK